jgi:2-dehydro-3-deoxyphosphogluconate aldolase / (4S)-4-hydroxy-2-oxoglutarate aldolase
VQAILDKRIVPVAVLDRVEDAVPLAAALAAGGLPIIEITFRTPAAVECVRVIKQQFPDMLVGAGTLLTPAQVAQAVEAGAQFGVAPGLNEPVVREAQALKLPFVPGVMTPSEVERALALGCKLLKFFPAEPAGGVKMLQALAGPYSHTGVKFIPLGGVSPQNAGVYLELACVAAIGGTWIADKKLLAAQDWAGITALAKAALAL